MRTFKLFPFDEHFSDLINSGAIQFGVPLHEIVASLSGAIV